MSATAVQAEQAATQARAAATAYETAFAMTVPPPVVAANRAQLMALIATNFLGQNTPAIAATEAHYAEMWVQDAVAMYGYAGSSAAASTLTPFTSAPPTTNPGALVGQAGAVTTATGTSAGNHAATIMTAVTQTLQALASPAASTSSRPGLTSLLSGSGLASLLGSTPVKALLEVPSVTSTAASSTSASASSAAVGVGTRGMMLTQELATTEEAQGVIRGGALGPAGGLGSATSGTLGTGAAPPVSANMGRASSIGALSVPQGWAVAAPETRLVAAASPIASMSTAPAAAESSSGSLFSEMALAGMAGRALGGTGGLGRRPQRGEATTRARTQQPQRSPGGPVTGIAAELRELAELRDSEILTDEEFTKLKQRLLGS